MSRIRGVDTEPEMLLRRLLFKKGYRNYRIHYNLPGKPDIVFVRMKVAIFVDGCFWHKCKRCFTEPRTRARFWLEKLNKNESRDKIINRKLSKMGWKVLRFWEHQVTQHPERCIQRIRNVLIRNSD